MYERALHVSRYTKNDKYKNTKKHEYTEFFLC